MIETRYNYVILGSSWDLYCYAFSDIGKLDNAKYIPGNKPPQKTFMGILYRLHFRPELNRYFRLPLQSLWNRYYFTDDFKVKRPLCFIFMADFARFGELTNYPTYLRKKYKDCKLVLYKTDLFSKTPLSSYGIQENICKLKLTYDLIISYDKGDSEKYGLVYYPSVFSHNKIPEDKSIPMCDVFFTAKFKGRLPIVLNMYDFLTKKGLVCDFYLFGVPEEKRINRKGIHYISRLMCYKDNLKHVIRSKCLLEIMQSDADGYTYRTWEAIAYKKRIITNNGAITKAPFYNTDNILYFNDIQAINDDFIKKIPFMPIDDYNYVDKISPIKLLEYIDSCL